jgi:TrmH family RNA methyltransferase
MTEGPLGELGVPFDSPRRRCHSDRGVLAEWRNLFRRRLFKPAPRPTCAQAFLLAAPVFPDLDAALADCGLAIGTTARPRQGQYGPPIGPEALPGVLADRPCARVALVFGNEADGLSTPELDRCQLALRLATPGDYSSYNVSHALAITLYLLRAALPAPGTNLAAPAAAPREQVERLLHYWLDTLERIHYFRRTSKERWSLRFRRLIKRLPLSPDDVSVFMGMLAQVNHFAARAKAGPAGADPPPGGTLH